MSSCRIEARLSRPWALPILLGLAVFVSACAGPELKAATPAPKPAQSGAVGGAAAPRLIIVSPADGATVVGPAVTINGLGPIGGQVTRDVPLAPDDHVAIRPDGTWTMIVRLGTGRQQLTFRIDDDRATERQLNLVVVEGGSSAAPFLPSPTAAPPAAAPSSPPPAATPFEVVWPPDGTIVGDYEWTLLGRAPAGAEVSYSCGLFCGTGTTADAFGRWSLVVGKLKYNEMTALELRSGDRTIVHHLGYGTVPRATQIAIPNLAGTAGAAVPELEVVDVHLYAYRLSAGPDDRSSNYGAQVIVTVRNHSPGPIALAALGSGIESAFEVLDVDGAPPRSTSGGELVPFPQFLGPGEAGYLVGEVRPDGYYDETSLRSTRLALAYDYVPSIPSGANATVETVEPVKFDYGYRATGRFAGAVQEQAYRVLVLALDAGGKPISFAVDAHTAAQGANRTRLQAPPNFEACCLRALGAAPKHLLGIAYQMLDVKTAGSGY
jgi:hypothetical protein